MYYCLIFQQMQQSVIDVLVLCIHMQLYEVSCKTPIGPYTNTIIPFNIVSIKVTFSYPGWVSNGVEEPMINKT